MQFKPSVLVSLIWFVFSLFISGCNKEAEDQKSLIANWIGAKRIRKYTTTNPMTNEHFYGYDTILCTLSGDNFSLHIKEGTLSSAFSIAFQLQSLIDVSYSYNQKKLSFLGNPYTVTGIPSDPGIIITSSVNTLSSSQLILYKADTVQRTPLIVNEVWYTFNK